MKQSSDASGSRDSSAGRRLTRAAEAYLEAHSAEKFSLQAVADAAFHGAARARLLAVFVYEHERAHEACGALAVGHAG